MRTAENLQVAIDISAPIFHGLPVNRRGGAAVDWPVKNIPVECQ
jgi:hypothetical protein